MSLAPRQCVLLACALLVVGLLHVPSPAASQWPWSKKKEPPQRFPQIAVEASWIHDQLQVGKLVLVDVRPAASYQDIHMEGARWAAPDVWQEDLPAEELLLRLGVSSPSTPVVCYGDTTSLEALGWLFWRLEVAGQSRVHVLNGGFEAWRQYGGKTSTLDVGPGALPPPTFTKNSSLVADVEYVRDRFGREGTELLDTRGAREWLSDSEAKPRQRVWRDGHVPHSLPFDGRNVIDAEGRFPSPLDLWRMIGSIGPRPGTTVDIDAEFLVYGAGEPSVDMSGWVYLLLRMAAVERIRVFAGGWREWSTDSDRPRVKIIEAPALLGLLDRDRAAMVLDHPPPHLALFDVRATNDHQWGHIPGALSLPAQHFADSLAVVLQQNWPTPSKSMPIAVYCYGPSCVRSRNCTTIAARNGHTRLLWVLDGLEGWSNAGGTLAAGGD